MSSVELFSALKRVEIACAHWWKSVEARLPLPLLIRHHRRSPTSIIAYFSTHTHTDTRTHRHTNTQTYRHKHKINKNSFAILICKRMWMTSTKQIEFNMRFPRDNEHMKQSINIAFMIASFIIEHIKLRGRWIYHQMTSLIKRMHSFIYGTSNCKSMIYIMKLIFFFNFTLILQNNKWPHWVIITVDSEWIIMH